MLREPTITPWRTRSLRSLLSIRARLLLIAVIAMAPLIAERVRGLEVGRTDRLRMAGLQTLDLAQNGGDAQEQILSSARAILQIAASDPSVMTAPSPACNRRLTEIDEQTDWTNRLSVVAPNGRIICSSLPEAIGIDVSDRSHFREALADRAFSVSDFLVSRANGRPFIAAASPRLGKDGSVDAVVVAFLDLKWIDRVLARSLQRSNASAFIVDGKGTVITRYPDAGNLATRNVSDHPLIREVLSRPSGTLGATGLDGERRIYGFTSLKGTNARLVVGVDEKQILSNINRQYSIALFVLATVTIAVLLAVWFVGERMIVRPIRALVNKAIKVGNGEFGVSQNRIQAPAEFAPLDRALDHMAKQFAAWEHELQQANKRLGRLATIDELTRLGNRRWFDMKLHDEWHASAARRESIALLLIDVDHFKRFNDRYGHLEGDTCLWAIATTIASVACRATDAAARYGGEEFVVLLPGSDPESAFAMAENIRTAVEKLAIDHADNPQHCVTISIGVASMLADDRAEPQRLVEAADAALYRAKRRGRNVTETQAPAAISLAG
jgi:diguanylate cyclase (GGDEF)-like protein